MTSSKITETNVQDDITFLFLRNKFYNQTYLLKFWLCYSNKYINLAIEWFNNHLIFAFCLFSCNFGTRPLEQPLECLAIGIRPVRGQECLLCLVMSVLHVPFDKCGPADILMLITDKWSLACASSGRCRRGIFVLDIFLGSDFDFWPLARHIQRPWAGKPK